MAGKFRASKKLIDVSFPMMTHRDAERTMPIYTGTFLSHKRSVSLFHVKHELPNNAMTGMNPY